MKFISVIFILLVATSSVAVPVDANNPNGFAAAYLNDPLNGGGPLLVLCTDGTVWRLHRAGSGAPTEYLWLPPETHTPAEVPVPVSEILDWTLWSVTTHGGDLYMFASGVGNEWHLVGGDRYFPSLPCSSAPVQQEKESLGDLKSRYR